VDRIDLILDVCMPRTATSNLLCDLLGRNIFAWAAKVGSY
jgi:hypothetical protein